MSKQKFANCISGYTVIESSHNYDEDIETMEAFNRTWREQGLDEEADLFDEDEEEQND